MTYGFKERLSFSQGKNCSNDIDTIRNMLSGAIDIKKSNTDLDKKGVDYVATLRGNAEIYIDAKRRDSGCSRFWKLGNNREKIPELAVEMWSVMPNGKYNISKERSKTGWTLDESKLTDMILYTFDILDTDMSFLVSFQLLRIAARKNILEWNKKYKVDIQDSGSWQSKAVFVPYNVVFDAVNEIQISRKDKELDTE